MIVLLTILFVLAVLIYLYSTQNLKYWELRGVKHDKPIPFFGTYWNVYTVQKGIVQVIQENYDKYPNEKIIGTFKSTRPELIIRDLDIAHQILSTDFVHFYARGFQKDKTVMEPLMKNLFFLDGDLWRLLRQRMTPAFTSGKLKAMFPLIIERAEKLQERLAGIVAASDVVDARDLMARFTTDFIGACAFGLNADSLNEENSPFRKFGVKLLKMTPTLVLKVIAKETMPALFKYVRIFSHVEKEFFVLLHNILQERNYEPSGRNDFIDLLLECQKKGLMEGESIEETGAKKIAVALTDELLAAQVLVFFAAGFETSSSATSYTLHQLAYNPDVQTKVQADIDRVLAKYDNKLSYEAVKEMTYLDWTFKEGLRIFPSLGFLKRQCSRKYTIPGVNVTIDEGVSIIIPVQSFHRDPQYFEDPLVFRPERFSPENFTETQKRVFMAFGAGNRACIGERLGLMQSLTGLAAVLSKFSVEPAPTTIKYPQVDKKSNIIQTVLNGLPLRFRERKDKIIY